MGSEAVYGDGVNPTTTSVLALAVSALALAVAAVSLLIGRERALITQRQVDAAAADLRLVEQERRHLELTPDLAVRFGHRPGAGADGPVLTVRIDGRSATEDLDEVVVRIRDDHAVEAPDGPAGDAVEAPDGPDGLAPAGDGEGRVRGPYRFRPGADGADATGRAVAPFVLRRGDVHTFRLERTPPPPWSDPDTWTARCAGQPLRLVLTCARVGHPTWEVRWEGIPEGERSEPAP